MTEQSQTEQPRRFPIRRGGAALVGACLLAIGGTVGAVAAHQGRPAIEMAPMAPVAISALSTSSDIVTLRGRVVEIYGNKFILADASGRMLVDAGRGGEDPGLVSLNAPVTVQGRFERGFVHASFLIGADGNVTALGPVGRGPHDRHGPPPPRPGDAPPPGGPPPAAGPAPAPSTR